MLKNVQTVTQLHLFHTLAFTGEGNGDPLQCFGHLMQRADSLEKSLMLEKTESRRKRGRQKMKLLDDVFNSMDMSVSKLWEMVEDREDWCAAVHGVLKESDMPDCLNNQRDMECSFLKQYHFLMWL